MNRRVAVSGHSLLEMIVASLIFVSVVVSVTSVWVWYGRAVGLSRYVLVGSQLGEELIEQCVGAGYHHVDALVTPTGTPRKITMRTKMRGQVIEVVYNCVVKVEDSSPLKRVSVEVFWETDGGPEKIAFETLLFRQE